ncbi:hypothetical protein L0U85_00415 [Glycomyces sp. L485]|uniref:hypothetical protein n=1 Tax=Glycomyces sp. L485 TaxID=2909235 RepID=UPI001F4BCB47|nr:hypothetical protein [Glycomyces sp. L485]MCH7229334.1 hypothetical protein [Glycomyces sp. L485]
MAVHRVILALETLVLLVLVGLIPYEVWSLGRQVDAYRQMGMPVPDDAVSMTAGQWAAIGLLAAVVAGGTLAALVRSHHRVVRGGVSEA